MIRSKTIEYAFPASTGSVAAGGARAFTQITVYIPETTSRTFRSCFVVVYVQDNVTTATSASSWRIQCAVGGAALDTTGDGATITDTISNTGEQCAWMFMRDVTSLFTADSGAGGWTNATPATNRTFDCTLTIGASSTVNASAKLVITYDYDDSATTRIKTVKIPIESATGARTTSLVELGSNQIPALDTFLPEASKTYRDIFFEINANDDTNTGGNDYTLGLALYPVGGALESRSPSGTIEAGLVSARFMYYIWKRTDMNKTVANGFYADVSSVTGGTFDCLGAVLVVTYEYDETNSTSIINSIQLPAFDSVGFLGGSAAGDLSRLKREFCIEEPTSITLVQSGVQLFLIDSGAVTLNVKAGGQSARAYTLPARMMCGGWSLIQRIDSGGAQGAGITLARGMNNLVLDLYSGSTTFGSIGTASTAILFLNYTSGKSAASGGSANHNHTVARFSERTLADAQRREFAAFAPAIPETNYCLEGIGFYTISFQGTAFAPLTLKAEVKTGEGSEDGWRELYSGLYNSDAEEGVMIQVGRGATEFKRYPTDPNSDGMDIETTRKYRLECTASLYCSFFMFYTYHTITFTISGTVSGYTGDGSGITVDAFRSDNNAKIGSTTTAAGGTFSITWYDNTINVYCTARQDSTHNGRSDNTVAT